jgi:anti-anti-sigma regulatory factor
MLRITRIPSNGRIQLMLEGKLMGPWVEELRQVCREATASAPALHLDLGAITFVDSAGTMLLADLIGGGAKITSRSSFVAELLRGTNA